MSQGGCFRGFFEKIEQANDNWLKMNIKGFKKLAIVLFYFYSFFQQIHKIGVSGIGAEDEQFNPFIFIDEGLKGSTYGTHHSHKYKPQLWWSATSG